MTSWPDIATIASEVNSGKFTAVSNVEKSLKAIAEAQEYGAIISTLEEKAMAQAKEIDQKIANSEPVGPLAGVPFIAKDNFLVVGGETTAASNILRGFKAPYQATAINKLEAAGAICVAKANLDAFAHGGSTENSDFFVTKNPADPSRVAGGSSGGSAAAVALGMAPFALGTDTGGSIRQPASFCGVVGFKPSYGVVSRSGVVAMGSSLDCIGPLCSRVEDVISVMSVISGLDPLDATTISLPNIIAQQEQPLKGLSVGLVKEYMGDGVSHDVLAAVRQTADRLQEKGAIISEVSLPSLPLALACYYIICPAEVSSNLSRYDGQRYGYSEKDAETLEQSYALSRDHGFGAEAKRRIMLGTYVLSSGYYDAYYLKAQLVRTKLINEFKTAFSEVDLLMGPVTPSTAFAIGQNTNDPLAMYLSDVMTVAANLTGVPSISLPIATDSQNLPIGLQLMAPSLDDARLLNISSTIEQEINK